MRQSHRLAKYAPTLVVLLTLIVVPALVILFVPGSSPVSAEVYSNEVGFIKVDTVDNGVVLASVPLVLLGDSPYYGLNNQALTGPGPVGLMLSADLVGSTQFATADRVMTYDFGYRTAWLYHNPGSPNDNMWIEGVNPTTLTLQPHQGFWIVRTHSSNPDTVTFVGGVRTDATVDITISAGFNMIGWPYPTEHDLQTSTLDADGAYGSGSFATADRIGDYVPGVGYEWHWLHSSGTWVKGVTPSTLKLEPERGYWYFRQVPQGSFTWHCAKPY
jgi:hypothetical protein